MKEKIIKIQEGYSARDRKEGAEPGANELAERLFKGQEPHHTTEWLDGANDKKEENNEENQDKSKEDKQ